MQPSAETAGSAGIADRADREYIARIVALFCAGWAVIYADRTVLYPLLSVIAREFGLSGVQTGLITGVYFSLYVCALLASGLLAERFGLKRMLVLFILILTLSPAEKVGVKIGDIIELRSRCQHSEVTWDDTQ